MSRLLVALATLVALSRGATAQVQPTEPTVPPDAPAAPAPAPPGDGADLTRAYDAAFAALGAGELDAAIAGFDDVALRAREPERRGAARELSRLARELRARHIRFVAGAAAPGVDKPTVRPLPEDDQPGAGRIEVIVTSTLASFYGGFVLIDLLELDDFRAGALLITATTGAGFVASLLATRDRDITGGMADAYTTGLLIGGANGMLLAQPLGLDEDEKGVLTLGLAGMALGGAAGLVVADRVRPTRAQANLAFTTGVMGLGTVGLGLGILQPDTDTDTVLLLLAGGLDVGAAAGVGVARSLEWSKGRARLVTLGAFLGAVAGVGGTAIAVGEPDTDEEGRVMSGAVLGGMWAGFALAVHFTRDMAPDPRFEADAAGAMAQVAPTVIDGRPGLGVMGRF